MDIYTGNTLSRMRKNTKYELNVGIRIYSDGEKMQRHIKITLCIVQRIKIYFRHRFKLSIYLWSSQICKVPGKLTKSQIRWQWVPHGGWTWTQSSHNEWGWSKRSYWPVDLVFIFFARLTNLAHHYVMYLAAHFGFSENDWTLSQPAGQPGDYWEPPNWRKS